MSCQSVRKKINEEYQNKPICVLFCDDDDDISVNSFASLVCPKLYLEPGFLDAKGCNSWLLRISCYFSSLKTMKFANFGRHDSRFNLAWRGIATYNAW